MQVSRADCRLHLSEHFGDAAPGAALRIKVGDLDELHRALIEKKYRHARPGIQSQPRGTQDMSISDPFGNKLIFTDDGGGA